MLRSRILKYGIEIDSDNSYLWTAFPPCPRNISQQSTKTRVCFTHPHGNPVQEAKWLMIVIVRRTAANTYCMLTAASLAHASDRTHLYVY